MYHLITILSAIFLVSHAMAATKPVQIVLLAGQSNMGGAAVAAKLPEDYKAALPAIKIWNPKSKAWSPLAPEVINTKGHFGPEISFGHQLAKAFPNQDIRFIKYAVSGTALYNDWSPVKKGKQYTEFIARTQAALADLKASQTPYEITALLWLQGESDAHEKKGHLYEENLTNFLTHLKTLLNSPDLAFINARVKDHYGKETGHAEMVRNAQAKVCDSLENAAWFDTDDCALLNAGHYNAEGILEIGDRFAKSYIKLLQQK